MGAVISKELRLSPQEELRRVQADIIQETQNNPEFTLEERERLLIYYEKTQESYNKFMGLPLLKRRAASQAMAQVIRTFLAENQGKSFNEDVSRNIEAFKALGLEKKIDCDQLTEQHMFRTWLLWQYLLQGKHVKPFK